MTRLEHYTDSDATDHERAKLWIARQLDGTNADNTLTGKELAEQMPSDFQVSRSTVADLIQEVRADYGIPVYSFNNGYYALSDVDDLERAIEQMDGVIQRKQQTKRELTEAFNTP